MGLAELKLKKQPQQQQSECGRDNGDCRHRFVHNNQKCENGVTMTTTTTTKSVTLEMVSQSLHTRTVVDAGTVQQHE